MRDARTRQLNMFDELIVDNFAGGGGASTGIEMALGRPIDIAINHDPQAITMHEANHPMTKHYCESVWDIDPVEVTQGRPVGLAWFSPDCFPAGTLVLTKDGYRPIEEIVVGDEVLTHKGRYRKVTETSQTIKPLLELKGHGHPGLAVSPEHPFYIRQRATKNGVHTFTKPDWLSASMVGKGLYWASPAQFPALPIPHVSVYKNKREMNISNDILWLAGRYVADGWTRLTQTRAELVIITGRDKRDYLQLKLEAFNRKGGRATSDELSWNIRQVGTSYQFSTNCKGLVEWLRDNFGHGASNKTIPGWVLGMNESARQAFLDGYLAGDGWSDGKKVQCTSISRSLIFGLKALASSLGFVPTIFKIKNQNNQIEGRTVNVSPAWSLRWLTSVDAEHKQTINGDGLNWTAVKSQKPIEGEFMVFNIGVEEDESYVVEGIVVHNCKHFSKAKGGKPREQKIRGLAWVALRWAATVKPRMIFLENVMEFMDWGPLLKDQTPCPERKGKTFRSFVRRLEQHGYDVEYKTLVACDYGAPTTRKRLFLIARCDGQPIVWPKPTHGAPGSAGVLSGKLLPWRTAAECIDWSLSCPSIFERIKPLADATLRRIARGIQKYVIDAQEPFIVTCNHQGDGFRGNAINEPFKTITSARDAHGLIMPTLVQTGYGERPGQAPRSLDIEKPLGTVVGQGQKHALAVATLLRQFGNSVGSSPSKPVGTITAGGAGKTSLVVSNLIKLRGTNIGSAVNEPVPTITAGGTHIGEVRAFLQKYFGQGTGQSLNDPAHTLTAKSRLGLVTINHIDYVIVDIGMRMLQPHELFLAQGFPENYDIAPIVNGKPLSKTAQVRMVGNSVSPPLAAALVAANMESTNVRNIRTAGAKRRRA